MLERAKIVSVSGNYADITKDGATILRRIQVVGDASTLVVGQQVFVSYVDNRMVVLTGGTQAASAMAASAGGTGMVPHPMSYHTDAISWHAGLSGAQLHNPKAHASTHLSGGSDSVDHNSLANYDANRHIDHTAVTLTAGAGLTGGGDISASRTLAVGAGALITVGADTVGITPGANYQFIGTGAGTEAAWQNLSTLAGDGLDHTLGVLSVDVTDIIDTNYGLTENSNNIRINLAATSGLNFSSGALLVGAGDGIDVLTNTIAVDVTDIIDTAYGLTENSNNIRVNIGTGMAFSSGALYAYGLRQSDYGANALVADANGDLTAYGGLAFNVAESITTNAGDLTIGAAGDLKLNPTGADVRIMASHTLKSDNYASQTTGWGITYAGGGDFRYLFADELHVKSFIADLEQALAGGQIISKSVAMLSRDFTAPAAGATATLYVWDLPSAENMAAFQANDIVRLRTFTRSAGSLTVANCWGVVTSYSNLTGKEQSWTFTRSSGTNAGSMAQSTVVAADSLALDYGTTGNGFHEVNAIDGAYGANSPYSQIVTWATHPATGQTVRTRLGNLYGITSETEYGLYAGEGVAAGDSYLRLTDKNFELHNLDLAMYDDGNVQRIGMDASAEATDKLMWAGPSATDPRFIVYGDGTTWLSTLTISEQMGDLLFSQADGLALWTTGTPISPTSWTSTRGQVATLSGAFHQVAGPWAQSRALVVEPAATNLFPNPSLETGTASWGPRGGATLTRVTTEAFAGTYSLRVVTLAGSTNDGVACDTGLVTASQTYTLTVRFKGIAGQTYRVGLNERTPERVSVGTTEKSVIATGGWQTVVLTRTFGATGVRARGLIDTLTAAGTFYADAWQLEQTAYATSYVDGDAGTGYAWSGTPHASTSTRAGTMVNLNAHAALLRGLDTQSFSIWAQVPYDANATWPRGKLISYVFDLTDGTVNQRIMLAYDEDHDKWAVYINGAARIYSPLQSFKAGDWFHIVVTTDFTNDDYRLYIDGSLGGSSTASLTAPAGLTTWRLGGSSFSDGFQTGYAIAEYAVFSRILSAEEVAAMYAAGRPITDAGSIDVPGVYILDGRFRIASGSSGTVLDLTSTRMAIGSGVGYNSGAGVWLGIDGGLAKFFVGNSAGNKLYWDGTTLYVVGNGSGITAIDGGNITALSITASQIAAATITGAKIAANTIEAGNIKAGTITTNEIAANTITAGNMNVATLSALAADMGTLTAGEIRVGTGTVGSTFTGYRIKSDVLGSYNNNVLQAWFDVTTGYFKAGAGAVTLKNDGIVLDRDVSASARVAVYYGSDYAGCFTTVWDGGGGDVLRTLVLADNTDIGGNFGAVTLKAIDDPTIVEFNVGSNKTINATSCNKFQLEDGGDNWLVAQKTTLTLYNGSRNWIEFDSEGYLNIRYGGAGGGNGLRLYNSLGTIMQHLTSDGHFYTRHDITARALTLSGTIKTTSNKAWNLGGTASGTITPDYKVHVQIDGQWYTLQAQAGLV